MLKRIMSKNSGIKPVKFIDLVRNDDGGFKLSFNQKLFTETLNNVDPSMEVCVITVNGAFRTGKSFILNFIAREFYGKKFDEFKWVHGKDLGTTGMWMLDKPAIIENNGRNIAVFLIDTQGIFDTELDIEATTVLFALSTLISSIQIFNIDKRIQEDNLQYLALFSEYAKAVNGSYGYNKPFQHINLLVRDWQNFEDITNLDKTRLEATNYISSIFDKTNKPNDLVGTREQILYCYKKISCCLLPHPGFKVAEGKYSGSHKDIRSEFLKHVDSYVKTLRITMEPKEFFGNKVLVGELPTFISKYCKLLQSTNMPKPKTLLTTTIEILYLNLIYEGLNYYRSRMTNFLENRGYIPSVEFESKSNRYINDTMKYFKEKAVLGSTADVDTGSEILGGRLMGAYYEFKTINESKVTLFYKYLWLISTIVSAYIIRLLTSNICTLRLCGNIHTVAGIVMYMCIIYALYILINYFNVIEIIKKYKQS